MTSERASKLQHVLNLVEAAYRAHDKYGDDATPAREAQDIVQTWLDARGNDAPTDRELASLSVSVGTLFVDIECPDEGQKLLHAAEKLLTPLLDADPSDLGLRAIFYQAQYARRDNYYRRLHPEEAETCLAKAIDIAGLTVNEHPQDETWQRKLVAAEMQVAHLLHERGRSTEARDHMMVAQDLFERMHVTAPDDELRKVLATGYLGLGALYYRMGRSIAARDFAGRREALVPSKGGAIRFGVPTSFKLGIAARLLADDPRQPGWSGNWVSVTGIVHSAGKLATPGWPGWLAYYEASLVVLRRRGERAPYDPDIRRDMSLMFERIGHLQTAMDRRDEALAAFEACRAIRDELVHSDPDNVTWQLDLALAEAKLGLAAQAADDGSRARQALSAGRSALARVLEIDPYLTALADDLAWFDHQLIDIDSPANGESRSRNPFNALVHLAKTRLNRSE